MQNELYPWQKSDYKYLLQLENRLPHSVLLHGPDGLGTLNLVKNWSKSLLCGVDKLGNGYCGVCNSCLLFDAGNHPDFYQLIINDEDKKSISITDVCAMVDFIALSPHLGRHKIIFIEDTQLLNLNSANALLKTLEEPAPYVIFILLSSNLNHVLPTILSRCYKYRLSTPDSNDTHLDLGLPNISHAKFWLKYYNNCPLFELEINDEQLERLLTTLMIPSIENIFNLSIEFDGKIISFEFILGFLTKWVSDLVQYKISAKYTYFEEYQSRIQPLIGKLQLDKAFFLHDRLNFLISWSNHPLNYKLQIENVLVQYQQLFVKSDTNS